MQPRGLEHSKSDELIQSASSLKISFGFKGKRPSRNSITGSTDEILDSLTRHAKLMEEDGKDRILGLQAVLEVECDEKHVPPSNLEATPNVQSFENEKPWKVRLRCNVYRRSDLSLDLFQTVGVLQSTDSSNTTVNYIEGGIHKLAEKSHSSRFSALIIALLARRSGRGVRSRLFSDVYLHVDSTGPQRSALPCTAGSP